MKKPTKAKGKITKTKKSVDDTVDDQPFYKDKNFKIGAGITAGVLAIFLAYHSCNKSGDPVIQPTPTMTHTPVVVTATYTPVPQYTTTPEETPTLTYTPIVTPTLEPEEDERPAFKDM